ncbi:MAG: FHIPEP family type III secretion protein [Spirochaetes bacterium]|nr:FHIPEP family type III secretion protein [Spirochaetota bacterium]
MAATAEPFRLTGNATLNRLLRNSDLLLAVAVVGVLAAMIIPMPTVLLDLSMIASLLVNVVILLVVLYTKSPIEFSVFPTLLFITTIFRLSINVSSTKLILTQGPSFEGKIVTAFADFVVGGNFVVGVIIFAIITIVQFMVLTKGLTRITEVAARFKLDGLPGKQLAIDAEVNAGRIDEAEAQKRRQELMAEADFFSNMDGAGKLVSGDVRAGLVIIIVNVIAGFVIGVVQRSESAGDALQNYIRLSVGDGLVAAIPSILVTVAAGIIATRGVSRDRLGNEMAVQVLTNPRILYVTAVFAALLGLIPGFPTVLLLITALVLFLLGREVSKRGEEPAAAKSALDEQKEEEQSFQPEKMAENMFVEPLAIELGYGLIPLADPARGGDLLERVKRIRAEIAKELGLIVPQVRITDNMQLGPDEYALHISGERVAGSKIRMNKLLAINMSGGAEKLEGEAAREPVFNLPAVWIEPTDRDFAERRGYSIFDGSTIIATHLTEIVKRNAGEILTRKDTAMLLDALAKRNKALYDEMQRAQVGVGQVQKVLQELLSEHVSIKNLDAIVETLADHARNAGGNTELLTEVVRQSIRRQICGRFADEGRNLNVLVLGGELEEDLKSRLSEQGGVYQLSLTPEQLTQLRDLVADRAKKLQEKGYKNILLTDVALRRPLQRLLGSSIPDLSILSGAEVAPGFHVHVVETV